MNDYKGFDLPQYDCLDNDDSRSEIMTLCGLTEEAPVFDHGDTYEDFSSCQF